MTDDRRWRACWRLCKWAPKVDGVCRPKCRDQLQQYPVECAHALDVYGAVVDLVLSEYPRTKERRFLLRGGDVVQCHVEQGVLHVLTVSKERIAMVVTPQSGNKVLISTGRLPQEG